MRRSVLWSRGRDAGRPAIAAAALAPILVAVAIPFLSSGPSVDVRSNSIARLAADGGRIELATSLGDCLGASAVGSGAFGPPSRTAIVLSASTQQTVRSRTGSRSAGPHPASRSGPARSGSRTRPTARSAASPWRRTRRRAFPRRSSARPGSRSAAGPWGVADSLTGACGGSTSSSGATTGERDPPGPRRAWPTRTMVSGSRWRPPTSRVWTWTTSRSP